MADNEENNEETNSIQSTAPTSAASKVAPPITLLQEICSRNGLTPDYQLLSTEGSVHEPTFKIAVTVADISAIASGQSKKKARHAAAREAIDRLRQKKELNFEGINFESMASTDEISSSSKSAYETANSEANPVGKLQEICMKMRVNPPDYDTCDERGLAHERIFYLSCNIASLNLSTLGQGRSKKLAKRQAAENMLVELETSGIYDKSADNNKGNKTEQGVESLYIDSDDNSHFVRSRRLVTEFLLALDSTESELRRDIEMIQENDVDGNLFYDLLHNALPESYEVQFHYMGDHMCLLHINDISDEKSPQLVLSSFGVGDNLTAMKNAVINAYRIILCLKNPLVQKDDNLHDDKANNNVPEQRNPEPQQQQKKPSQCV